MPGPEAFGYTQYILGVGAEPDRRNRYLFDQALQSIVEGALLSEVKGLMMRNGGLINNIRLCPWLSYLFRRRRNWRF